MFHPLALDERPHLVERGGHGLERDRVLHLAEAHGTVRREDGGREVGEVAIAGDAS